MESEPRFHMERDHRRPSSAGPVDDSAGVCTLWQVQPYDRFWRVGNTNFGGSTSLRLPGCPDWRGSRHGTALVHLSTRLRKVSLLVCPG